MHGKMNKTGKEKESRIRNKSNSIFLKISPERVQGWNILVLGNQNLI